MADRSLVVVNYRSAPLCRDAVASARAASCVPLEVVVVDNSCDPSEAAELETVNADRLVVAPTNLGYAGGANAGIRAASGQQVVVSNPDVVFGERCIDELLASLTGRVALAGPRFSWDASGTWLLPPAGVMTLRSELARALTRWSHAHAAARSRRRFGERLAFWRASSTIRVAAVSGAVMAIDRESWARVGGFDERFRLYYEEIDFMRQLARLGREVVYVPGAHCHHIYDQSAASGPDQQGKFAESEALYMAKWNPRAVRMLRWMQRGDEPVPPASIPLSPSDEVAVPLPPGEHVIEASPLESFETAAGHFPEGTAIQFPADIWTSYHGRSLFLRVVEAATGREVFRGVMRKSA